MSSIKICVSVCAFLETMANSLSGREREKAIDKKVEKASEKQKKKRIFVF